MNIRAKVLIVDDHPLVREGLAARISRQKDMQVCGEAADVEEALALVEATEPSLIIVDLALRSGHGLNLIKAVGRMKREVKMLVVSAYDESLYAERVLRTGAHGYINKQEVQEKIIDALRAVLRGEVYLSTRMTQRVVTQVVGATASAQGLARLSDREVEVFELIGRGRSTRAIGEQLHLSIHTIETYREHIRDKLGLRDGTELVQRAVQWVLESS
jgi:DNA-binding NarL/FixJ family response regulator